VKPPRLLVGAVGVAALASCSVLRHAAPPQAASPSPSPRPPVAAPLPVTPGSYVGVREQGAPYSYRGIESFARATGSQPRLALYFSGWNDPFQARFARTALAHHTVALVQMDPDGVSMASIAAGQQDGYLRSFAQQVRSFGYPVVIGFAHEMNGPWYSWGYGHTAPRVWVAAWRHVVTVFKRAGASNVTWLWTASSGARDPSLLRAYWPGAAYVDWVGIDGYFYYPTRSFTDIFGPSIKVVRGLTHAPILLSETAVGPSAGQAHMIPDLFAGIRDRHLLGLVWFDISQHAGVYHQDWRLEGHPAALRLFRRGVQSMRAS
jgi:Glycosyl hydrolase family 26